MCAAVAIVRDDIFLVPVAASIVWGEILTSEPLDPKVLRRIFKVDLEYVKFERNIQGVASADSSDFHVLL